MGSGVLQVVTNLSNRHFLLMKDHHLQGPIPILIDQFHVDVTVTSLAAAHTLWWPKHMVTRGVKREKSTE